MTIKQTLLIITLVLAAFAVFLSGQGLLKAQKTYSNAIFAEETTPGITGLLAAAGHWAVERGVTNAALAYPNKVPQSQRAIIAERRLKGDEAYKMAMGVLQDKEFENKETFMSEVAAEHEEIMKMRKEVDTAMDQSKLLRSSKLTKNWVPSMSKLILKSQKLRFAIGQLFSEKEPEMAGEILTKHFTWVMAEYAGRERAIVGGLLSSNKAINAKTDETLANFRGRVESAWDSVLKISSTDKDPKLRKAIDHAQKSYFEGEFQALREAIHAAGIEGEEYPVESSEWIKRSTAAINTILEIQQASIEETEHHIEDIKAKSLTSLMISGAIMLISIISALAGVYVVLRNVTKPLNDMTDVMNKLADGDTSVEIEGLSRKDEIGKIATSVQVFKENAIEKELLEAQQAENERLAEMQKRKMMNDLANDFDIKVGSLIESIAAAATELQSTSQTMTAIADETSSSSQSVAASSEEASTNVATVASAMEEMSAASQEIAAQIANANTKSKDTAASATDANATVGNLNELVENIGEVVTAIRDIAEQTNLLALNATIEAARAGEAGKGFAVVADEVKKLANETSQKTEEIDTRITEIQEATQESVAAMEKIIGNISEIDDSVTGVSAAVEEQNATNIEIVRSVGEASDGVQNVSQIIIEVQKGAGETGNSASAVLDASSEMAKLSNDLKSSVDQFLDQIRQDNKMTEEPEENNEPESASDDVEEEVSEAAE